MIGDFGRQAAQAVGLQQDKLSHASYRIGFLAAGALLFNLAVEIQRLSQTILYPANALLAVLCSLCAFVLVGLALLPRPFPRLTLLLLIVPLIYVSTQAQMDAANATPLRYLRPDNEMIASYSVAALVRGENPYQWDFSDMLRVFRDPGSWTTFFLDGTLQNRVTYPILPSLTLAALERVGIDQVKTVNVAASLGLMMLLYFGAPTILRPVILLPLLAIHDFFKMGMLGAQDALWSLLLVSMILAWKRPFWRAVLFGLAITYRQQPWFIAPFLLILIWQEGATRREQFQRTAIFAGIALAVFAAFNLPFIVHDARAWFNGAFEPLMAAFNWISQGAGALTQYGLLNLPRSAYTFLQFAFYVGALLVFWRHARFVGQAFWIVPALFFWLYYRGLANYWFYWIPPLLMALVRWLPDGTHPIPLPPSRSIRVTAWVAGVVVAASVLVLGLSARSMAAVSLTVLPPVGVVDYAAPEINMLIVRVTNDSDRLLRPRFSVQLDRPPLIFPWRIVSGPETLAAGASGTYRITADSNPVRMAGAGRGAQVVLSDASGDYTIRALADVSLRGGFEDPRAVQNAQFVYRSRDAAAPTGWTLEGHAVLSNRVIDGRPALVARSTDRNLSRLVQTIDLPVQMAVWVFPPRGDTGYGITFFDGTHQFSVNLDGMPPQQWSRVVVDFAAHYAESGGDLPAFTFDAAQERYRQTVEVSVLLPALDEDIIFGGFEDASYTDALVQAYLDGSPR